MIMEKGERNKSLPWVCLVRFFFGGGIVYEEGPAIRSLKVQLTALYITNEMANAKGSNDEKDQMKAFLGTVASGSRYINSLLKSLPLPKKYLPVTFLAKFR